MMEKEFTVPEIKELMMAMRQNQMGKLKIESGDYSLTLEGGERVVFADAPQPLRQASGTPLPEEIPAPCGNVVTSPIVGTFYEAASPESEPFVTVGKAVKKGDTLFIIESMKLMNEVQSHFDGTVTAIHVQNAQGVEYGQPILTIE